jgi:hypothetical protein
MPGTQPPFLTYYNIVMVSVFALRQAYQGCLPEPISIPSDPVARDWVKVTIR